MNSQAISADSEIFADFFQMTNWLDSLVSMPRNLVIYLTNTIQHLVYARQISARNIKTNKIPGLNVCYN